MNIIYLSREAYLESVQKLDNFENLKFLKAALDTWDNYYSWVQHPPLALQIDEEEVCYLFYHISKDKQYLTIHNILTPSIYRKNNYAYTMLEHLFVSLQSQNIQRCKLHTVHNAIHFYNKLGLTYWGVNDHGLYYSDFKMPFIITDIKKINQNSSTDEFSNEKLLSIYNELKNNGCTFDEKHVAFHQECLQLMGFRFKFEALENAIKQRDLYKVNSPS